MGFGVLGTSSNQRTFVHRAASVNMGSKLQFAADCTNVRY